MSDCPLLTHFHPSVEVLYLTDIYVRLAFPVQCNVRFLSTEPSCNFESGIEL